MLLVVMDLLSSSAGRGFYSQQDARVIREQALSGKLFTALLNHLTKVDAQQALMHAAL